jgi:anti-sigma B factor antagonist
MRLSERHIGDAMVLDLNGALAGTEAAELLESTVSRLSQAGARKIVTSLAGVGCVDSTGLGALVDCHLTALRAGGSFKLACIANRIEDLVVIARLLTVFNTSDSVEEAVTGTIPATARPEASEFPMMAPPILHRFFRHSL